VTNHSIEKQQQKNPSNFFQA